MKDYDEVIFNLFIYEFMDCYYLGEKIEIDSEITYKTLLGLSQFKLLKDCFPINEYCDDIREVSEKLSCGCCHRYISKPANYIED